MIEYMEARIAKGEKITLQMYNDAVQNCENGRILGYATEWQELQKGFIEKYWNKATELKNAYLEASNK